VGLVEERPAILVDDDEDPVVLRGVGVVGHDDGRGTGGGRDGEGLHG